MKNGNIRKMMDRLNQNSHYGLMIDTEITKLVRDHMKEKEDNKMEPTSVWKIENIDKIWITQDGDEISLLLKNRDDLTKIILVGEAIKNHNDNFITTLKVDLEENEKEFSKQDQKIRELEKELNQVKQKNKAFKDTADTWSKEYYNLSKKFDKLQEENEKMKDKLKNIEPFRSLERTIKEKQQLKEEYEEKIDVLKRKYNLEREANEAQHKFFREYAGKGTEIEFNYAIDDVNEVSYVIVDKERYQTLKDNGCNVTIHGKDYTPMQLVDRIFELERLKTPTIENFADEEPSDKPSYDNVNHPSHYTGRYECIDVMQDVFGDEATNDFCLCNAFKYIWRARKKNGLEDVKKAVWYLNKYIEEAEKDGVSKGERV